MMIHEGCSINAIDVTAGKIYACVCFYALEELANFCEYQIVKFVHVTLKNLGFFLFS